MTTLTRSDVKVLSDNANPAEARGRWWHIQIGEDFYIVSAADLGFAGVIPGYRTSETMAFPADANAEVTSWGEVAFVPYKDHEACITDLLGELNGRGVDG